MRSSIRGIRLRLSLFPALAAAVLLVLAGSGCSAQATSAEGADTNRGKEIFTQKCGACHVLRDAGTAGQTGPNLDDAFGYARGDGFDQSTLFEVTLEQMQIPAPPMPDYDDEADEANYLSEEDRVAIAAYVSEVAGNPGEGAAEGPQANDPESIFSASCGSCHTFSEAGSTGSVGPNLDETSLTLEEAVQQISKGGNGMPAFEGQLTDEQIRALAEYVVGG